MSPEKTGEPTAMPFSRWARVGPHNHVLDGSPDPPVKGAILGWEKDRPIAKYREHMNRRRRKEVWLDRDGIWYVNVWISTKRTISWKLFSVWLCGDDAAFCQITLTSCSVYLSVSMIKRKTLLALSRKLDCSTVLVHDNASVFVAFMGLKSQRSRSRSQHWNDYIYVLHENKENLDESSWRWKYK